MLDEDILETPEGDESPESLETPHEATPDGDAQIEDTPEESEADKSEKVAAKQGFKQRKREARLKEQNRELQAKLDQREAATAQPELKEPNRDDYSDYEQFLEARSEYVAEKRFSDLSAKADAKQAERDRTNEQRTIETRWEDSTDTAREKYDDFDEVAFGEVNVTETMGLAIKDSDDGGEIAYYLGKNPEESDKIAKLSPLAQIKAIGRIEERLIERPTRKPPPTPVNRGRTSQSTASSKLNDKMSMADWQKARNKEVRG